MRAVLIANSSLCIVFCGNFLSRNYFASLRGKFGKPNVAFHTFKELAKKGLRAKVGLCGIKF